MPSESTPNRPVRLSVEALESREVPAFFGPTRGLSIARGDVMPTVSGIEYITGTGPGRAALVRVWNANSGNLLFALRPFGSFSGGVYVATGDVNNDGQMELIVSTAAGTTGEVQVYEFIGGGPRLLGDFMPFGPNYSGGVQITAGSTAARP